MPLQGFPSKPRNAMDASLVEGVEERDARRAAELAAGTVDLCIAWALVALCCTHHMGHVLHMMGLHQFAHAPVLHSLGSPLASAGLGALALAGPGRAILLDGTMSLIRQDAMDTHVPVGGESPCTLSITRLRSSSNMPTSQ